MTTINPSTLRPSTLAAIIADLVETLDIRNLSTIQDMLHQLEITVGDEESVDYLAEAGVTPAQMDAVYDNWDWDHALAQAEAAYTYPGLLAALEDDGDIDLDPDLDLADFDLPDWVSEDRLYETDAYQAIG